MNIVKRYRFSRALRLIAVLALACSELYLNREFGDEPSPTPGVSSRGLVSLIADVYVPAHRSGRVTSIVVKEGVRLDKDAIVAQIDVRQEELEVTAAQAEHAAAELKAMSDVESRYAAAAFKVAQAEMISAQDANRKVNEVVSRIEMERLKLTVEQSGLKIEAAEHELATRRTESDSSKARLDLARLKIEQSRIRSPIEGEIAEVCIAAGEWIEVGKPLARVVDLRRLRVETFVGVKDRRPGELNRRPVKIQVALAHDTTESFVGEIAFVNPVVQPGGFYRVWIEVVNRREHDQWILRPGMEVEVGLD